MRGGRIALAPIAIAIACGNVCACGDGSAGPDAAPLPPDADLGGEIDDLLAAIPGVTIVSIEAVAGDRWFFRLVFDQPADHARPDGLRFGQRVTLLHRSRSAPTVLATSGYYVWDEAYAEEPTALLDANQIAVEHRFFDPSRPAPADWSLDTIRQAADDHHRIVGALRAIYPDGAWISTGASKGGMTAIFHRRFHPDDVDGTIAYVAPISFGAPDDRYLAFFDTVGDAPCRDAIRAAQRELLARKPAMRALMDAQAALDGWTYDRLGPDVAFENAAIELEWAFWQYFGIASCGEIPTAAASDDELYAFLDGVVFVPFFSDPYVDYFSPYYYQAADELGYPSIPVDHVADLAEFESLDTIPLVIPPGSMPSYDPTAMQDVAEWVANGGDRLLFVYGEWDPWTAGSFDLGNALDSFELWVPEGTHGASISLLPAASRAIALDALERWTGVIPSGKPALRSLRGSPRERLRPLR